MCGRTSGTDITNIAVELGEIKSSNANEIIKKGYHQLLLRLAVFGYVIDACFGRDETPKFNLFGKIYMPTIHPNFKIPEKWKEGINFPSAAKFHVDIIL